MFDGPEGSTIITERNKKALAVLGREISQGGQKRLAVFYGAGHLPDCNAGWIRTLKCGRRAPQWLSAWSLAAAQEIAGSVAPFLPPPTALPQHART